MTNKLLAILIAVFMSISLAACDTAEERAEKHLQSAVSLLSEGDTARALVEMRNIFQLVPTHREGRKLYAATLEESGDIAGAFRQYAIVAEQYPDEWQAALRVSEISIDQQQWEIAEEFGRPLAQTQPDNQRVQTVQIILNYRQAALENDTTSRGKFAANAVANLEESPKNLGLRLALLDWYMFDRKPREALTQVEAALEIDPGRLNLYQTRLQILQELGETSKLEDQLIAMTERFPENEEIVSLLVRWYLSRSEVEEAEAFLRQKTQQENPELASAAIPRFLEFVARVRGVDAALEQVEKMLPETSDPDLVRLIKAELLFTKGDREDAIALLENMLEGAEASEQANRAKVQLARMQATIGNAVASRALVEEVLASDPTHVDGLKLKSESLIQQDQADEAIVLLRRALDQAPQDAQILTLTALAHERNGNRDLMGETLALAVEVSNRAPAETLRLARFLSSREQFAPAEQAILESLRLSPNNIELLRALGNLQIRTGRLAEARQVVATLDRMENEPANALKNALSLQILEAEDRDDELLQMVESLTAEIDDDTVEATTLVQTHLRLGDIAAANSVIDAAIAENPDSDDLKFAKGVVLARDGQNEAALELFEGIVTRAPEAANAWNMIASVHSVAGDVELAEGAIDRGLEANPTAQNLLLRKAGFLERKGEISGAIEIYEQLYDERSSSVVAANNLASLLSSYSDDADVVERAYQIARRLRGIDQPAFQDTYGWIAFQRGDLEDALEHLEPAAAGLAGDALVQYHLGRVYEALDRPAEAAEQYRKTVELADERKADAFTDAANRLETIDAAAVEEDN